MSTQQISNATIKIFNGHKADVINDTEEQTASASSDPGFYIAQGLPEGPYTIAVSADGKGTVVQYVEAPGDSYGEQTDTSLYNIQMVDGRASLGVTLEDNTEAPVPNTAGRLLVSYIDGAYSAGEWTVPNVPIGAKRLLEFIPEAASIEDYQPYKTDVSVDTTNDLFEIIYPPFDIQIIVQHSNGSNAAASVIVEVKKPTENVFTPMTVGVTSFRFNYAWDGQYTFRVRDKFAVGQPTLLTTTLQTLTYSSAASGTPPARNTITRTLTLPTSQLSPPELLG